MDMNDFKRLQQVQMEIMDDVHRVCVENKIRYYIIGGTALGAKRHSGFIPWDMDIDIAMPREDYEKFESVAPLKLSQRFIYRTFKNTKGYTRPHGLVCVKNTYLTKEKSQYNKGETNFGIFLDVFPLDKAPEDRALQQKHANQIRKIRRLKDFKHGYRHNNSKLKAIEKKIVSCLIFWTSLDKLNLDFDNICKKYMYTSSPYLCSMASRYRYEKQCMTADIYGTPTLVNFEDREYYAPEKLDEYLTKIYGDYMKLPPEKEREANLEMFDKVIFDCAD